jgi:TM2 domain-containing membrane protein YozV
VTASATVLGLITGLALGFAAVFGGLTGFVIVLLLGAMGLGVGRYLDGQLDLSALSGRGTNRLR